MAKKLMFFIIFLTFLSVLTYAVPVYVVFEEIVDGAENFSHIEVLTNAQKEHSGFIFCDTLNKQIIVSNFNNETVHFINALEKPYKTIHYYSSDYDTLFVFAFIMDDTENPKLLSITISDNEIIKNTVEIARYKSMLTTVNHVDLSFQKTNNLYEGIWFELNTTEEYSWDPSNWSVSDQSTSALINIHDNYLIDKYQIRTIKDCDLTSNIENEHIQIKSVSDFQYQMYYDSIDENYVEIKIVSSDNNILLESRTDNGIFYSYFVDNFAPSSVYDEFIYHGHTFDLLNYHNRNEHIACYSFTDGQAEELWYNDEISGISFEYVFNQKDLLIGTRGNNEVIMLDYLNGQISDSSNLDRDLSHITFFETGETTRTLNLTGRKDNKIFVYQFDMVTSVNEPYTKEEIPLTFKLFQNHPNPFNGETRIEFETDESQHLTLSIYNILGQEIKNLASKTFAAGIYQYYWDGNNQDGVSQASGIYFARLESSSGSTMIKLIYMK
ncbi:FlgD immunoglobulin-like domain containing protein [Candidatus Zixiibacteriota bacterium]